MESLFYTLQDFLSHTEGVTYVLIVCTLVGMAGFWHFLNQRDDDNP